MLYFKEHPVCIGTYDYFQMRRLAKIPNIRMIDPKVNSHDLIRHSQGVITVNSKVGFEALYHLKPVITLGDSFYRNRGLTMDVGNMADLDKAIRESAAFRPDRRKLIAFIHSIHANSLPGELYQNTEANYRTFAASLMGFLGEHRD
jgi:capsule polysaccharide modification protein KpsS